MKLYFKYVQMNIRSLMQYKSSFIMTVLGQLIATLFYFLGIYLLFDRFGNVRGFTFGEVMMCFSVSMFSFSIAECVARGFDSFSTLVKSGNFDRVLLRPRGTIVQVLGSRFELARVERLIYASIILVVAVNSLETVWNSEKTIVLVLMLISGICLFTGLFILGATVCFFTVEGLEIVNIFTDGGREMTSYPLSIYAKPFIVFFTFVIPFGSMNYLPLLFLINKTSGNNLIYMLSPLAGIIFIIPCIFIWNIGVKHYLSTGS